MRRSDLVLSYGELGLRAISIALSKITVQGSILPPYEKIKPLKREDWFQYVMIPEVGRMLIQQDMQDGVAIPWFLGDSPSTKAKEERNMSWRVLEQSRAYGSLRFSEASDFDTSDSEWERESRQAANKKPTRPLEHIDLT